MANVRYAKPGWLTRNVFNRAMVLLTRAGLNFWGSQILQVRGRKTGDVRETPVNLLTYGRGRYLVAPRGQTQWVRNLRAAGGGALRLGRGTERFRAVEIRNEDKPEILRTYLRRWKAEVGVFFGGVGAASSEEELLRIAPNHPVFRIEPTP
jgi:deazaflavin-dependent oxidoreductase (nitroreductase family)